MEATTGTAGQLQVTAKSSEAQKSSAALQESTQQDAAAAATYKEADQRF